MADNVSVSTTSTTDLVDVAFSEVLQPVSVTTTETVDSVLVSVNENSSVDVSVTNDVTNVAVSFTDAEQSVAVNVTDSIDNVSIDVDDGTALWVSSFDTVSRNLSGYPYTVTFNGSLISQVVFNLGSTTITKTYNYTSGLLTSIVLSGDTPDGINLTKSLTYTSGKISSVSYS